VQETELLVCEEEGGPVVTWVEGPVPGVSGCRLRRRNCLSVRKRGALQWCGWRALYLVCLGVSEGDGTACLWGRGGPCSGAGGGPCMPKWRHWPAPPPPPPSLAGTPPCRPWGRGGLPLTYKYENSGGKKIQQILNFANFSIAIEPQSNTPSQV
jgi:hypothetical protein